MSILRIIPLAAALGLSALAAAAQTPAAPQKTLLIAAMEPDAAMPPVMDSGITAHVLFDQLEGRFNGSNPEFRWDGQGWVGTDFDKLWIKSEGTLGNGTLGDGQQQVLYDRAITTYFDLQGGLRSDLDSRPTRNWAAFGIQGLAPYFFDLEVTAYASSEGHFAGKVQASYDLLITQRLILQPQAELNLYSRPIRPAWSAPDFPISIPGCGCATSSAGNSRPISASSTKGHSGKRQNSRARRARAPATCASSSASGPGSKRG
jgi:copper resistance protein B